MFCEHLADADDAALKRLDIVYMLWRHPFGGVSFLLHPLLSLRPPPLSLRDIPLSGGIRPSLRYDRRPVRLFLLVEKFRPGRAADAAVGQSPPIPLLRCSANISLTRVALRWSALL